ncbi:MAG: helix-turn-helix domain-containing protein [Woeseiaceae bacterium]
MNIAWFGHVADIFIGFSVVSACLLWLAYVFFLPNLRKSTTGKIACTLLLGTLVALQCLHYQVWASDHDLLADPIYMTLLMVAPPSFYLFSRTVLLPGATLRLWHWLHFMPVVVSFLLPKSLVLLVALAIGAGYSLWFVQFVYGMRRSVKRFRFEMFFYSFFAVEALLVFLLAISLPYIDATLFHVIYAMFTGIALALIVLTLLLFPDVVDDLSSAATLAYSKSTLDHVNVGEISQRLATLMDEEKLYRNEHLNLSMLADALDMGSHQVSELMNTHFGCNFSTYIRRKRVEEAKKILAEDHRSSILSISMMIGFRSQSNFYAAFKALTGESPGAFRKRHS